MPHATRRWNPAGQRAVYCSSSRALCALEYLVHVGDIDDVPALRMLGVELPDDLGSFVDFSAGAGLPADWREPDGVAACQRFGAAQLDTQLGFKVPSVLVPAEWNLVLNPVHPTFAAAVRNFRDEGPFAYDPRLIPRHVVVPQAPDT